MLAAGLWIGTSPRCLPGIQQAAYFAMTKRLLSVSSPDLVLYKALVDMHG